MLTGVFAPLRVADYRRLWLGQIVSVVGDKINQIAMAMMVYAITGSMLQMGLMLGITFLPAAIFGVFAGVYVDRWDHRTTMVWADIARGILVLSIPFVVPFGLYWAYLIAFSVSTIALFFLPAKRAVIPDIVPADQLMAANSLDNASESVSELVGLALGGALMSVLQYRGAFIVDASTFVFSAIMIYSMTYRRAPSAHSVEPPSVLGEAREGLEFIGRSNILRELMAVYIPAAVFGSAAISICYALALVRYKAGAPGLALLDAGIAVGALIGALAVARSGPGRPGLKFLFGTAAFGASLMLISLAGTIWVAVILFVMGGVANMWFFIPATTIMQTHASPELRGRVMAALTTATRLAMVVGLVGAGALADRTSIPLLTALTGAAAVAVALIGFSSSALRSA
ncbi:MAG: MFS transporter [Coriobacteriia bacterium]|nr:MFS transporter [Coriobacteriia bacterium]